MRASDTPSASRPVAVIDIGSNSIKVLVAQRKPGGRLRSLDAHALDVRISAGISLKPPRLGEEGMRSGVAAVQALIERSRHFQPAAIHIVATSAVRDAVNGADFRSRIKAATGIEVRVLSGEEEANLIGRGLLTDPAVAAFSNFYLFDLGGGSLECLSFRARKAAQAVSLPLGCVRLTEICVADPRLPFSPEDRAAVASRVKSALEASSFTFELGPPADALFIGGTMTATRFLIAAATGIPPESAPTAVAVAAIEELFHRIAPLTLEERKQVPALPAARADVLPAALATVLALAEIGRIRTFNTSFHNLRWGVADEALPILPSKRQTESASGTTS